MQIFPIRHQLLKKTFTSKKTTDKPCFRSSIRTIPFIYWSWHSMSVIGTLLVVPALLSVAMAARFTIEMIFSWPSYGTTARNITVECVFVPNVFILPVTNAITEQLLLWIVGISTSQHVHYLKKLGDNFSM